MNDKLYKQLPAVLQTTAIKNFFESTVEQLFSKSNVDQIRGFIGSKTSRDQLLDSTFLTEPDLNRRYYALSPVVNTINPVTGDPDNLLFYDEIIDILRMYNVPVDDHNRIFDHDSYHFLPPIDIDKFINYQEYFWYPQGPSRILVSGPISVIDIDADIIGQAAYTTPIEGIQLQNGMKIRFVGTNITSQSGIYGVDVDYIVEGVGDRIRLVEFEQSQATVLGGPQLDEKDYVVIQRGQTVGTAWSRANSWYHRDLFELAGDTLPGRAQRAERPIIEFDRRLEMVNAGGRFIRGVTVAAGLDFDTSDIIGVENETRIIDDHTLVNGDTVIFLGLGDLTIYEVGVNTLVDPAVYTLTDIATLSDGQSIVIEKGFDKLGVEYDVVNGELVERQLKTELNQSPLFQLYDDELRSLNDPGLYNASTFVGSPIFAYARGTGTADHELGFPLEFTPFKSASEIKFVNHLEDRVSYTPLGGDLQEIPGYYYYKLIDFEDQYQTAWIKNQNRRQQRVTVTYEIIEDNKDQTEFDLGAVPAPFGVGVDVRVEVNGVRRNDWIWNSGSTIEFNNLLYVGDTVTMSTLPEGSINAFSPGRYDVTDSIWKNPFNEEFESISRPEYLEHFGNYLRNQIGFRGEPLGNNNSRNIAKLPESADCLIQTSQDTLLGVYLIDDQPHNLVSALRFNSAEYEKYKLRLINQIDKIYQDRDTSDWSNSQFLEQALREVISFSVGKGVFDQTYVIPFGDIYQEERFTVNDETQRVFESAVTCNLCDIENSLLVYLKKPGEKEQLLVVDTDYTINDDAPIEVTIVDSVALSIDDEIVLRHYDANRNSAQCPPTPSSMGLYPLYEPAIFVDHTFATPKTLLRGHDGSRIETYGDLRDDIMLEYERRIYNSARAEFRRRDSRISYSEINVRPSISRDTGWQRSQWYDLLRPNFVAWANRNRVDPVRNDFYDANDPATWYYTAGGGVPGGHWRGIFEYLYDTQRPHTHPWEMLGFTEQPAWWESQYGAGPWPNTHPLWEDVFNGIIRDGDRENFTNGEYFSEDNLYRRDGRFLPVDENGELRDFNSILGGTGDDDRDWSFGDGAPAENAWKYTSTYPFAVAEALLLAHPGRFASTFGNPLRISRSVAQPERVIDRESRRPWDFRDRDQFPVHGSTVNGEFAAAVGYTQFIASWLRFQGLNIDTDFEQPLRTLNVRLGHRMAGFVDKDTMTVRTDQYSTTGNAVSLIIPNENLSVITHSSPYKTRNYYSGVQIEKTERGYKVRGYDTDCNVFKTLASNTKGARERVSVGGEPASFREWKPNQSYNQDEIVKFGDRFYKAKSFVATSGNFQASFWQSLASLPVEGGASGVFYRETTGEVVDVSYDTEYESVQEVYDLLISIGRYNQAQGYDFGEYDDAIRDVRDWRYAAKQFLFWVAGGWQNGNTLSLSPAAERVVFRSENQQIAKINRIDRNQFALLDQDGRVIQPTDCEIVREDDRIEIIPPNGRQIYGTMLFTKQVEHALVADNETEFADTIYAPKLAQRHTRLKVKGVRTANWRGRFSSEGFIIDGDELAPNLDNMAESLGRYHELGFVPVERQLYESARRLFGYQERDYLRELDILDDQQFEFYKGMIQTKGTENSLKQIARSSRVSQGNVNVYDEWAIKVGDFGDVFNEQSIELRLIKNDIINDPQLITLDFPEDITGVVSEIRVLENLHSYQTPPQIVISPPPGSNGRRALAQAVLNDQGEIAEIQVTDPGRGYTDTPGLTVLAANIRVGITDTQFQGVQAISSDYVSNITGLDHITITDNFSANVANIDLSAVTEVANIVTLVNENAAINANISVESVASGLGNSYILEFTGSDFTIGGDAGTLANLHIEAGRYQPRQRYAVETANNTVASNVIVRVDGVGVPEANNWQFAVSNVQVFATGVSATSGSASVELEQSLQSENLARVNSQYPYLEVYLDGVRVFNPGWETRFTANTTHITFPDVTNLPTGSLSDIAELTVIEKATVDFEDAYQGDLPGSELEIFVETNDAIAVIVGSERTFAVTPDRQGDDVLLIDIDDTERFLKKPVGVRDNNLWPTTSNLDWTGITDAKYRFVPNAGYVNPANVDYQAFDIASLSNLWDRDLLYRPGKGDLIHVALSENREFNIYDLKEIEGNVSYVQQAPDDETTYLLTDFSLTEYTDSNSIDGLDTARYLDYYLVLKRTDVSDNLVIWTNEQQVEDRAAKLVAPKSSYFAMIEVGISSIGPAANTIQNITDLRPAITAVVEASALQADGNNTVLVEMESTLDLADGDQVSFVDFANISALDANTYTIANVTSTTFTVQDANVTANVDSANLRVNYFGATEVEIVDHGFVGGDLVRVFANGYNGYHYVESAQANSFVIDSPYIAGGSTTGEVMDSGILITTSEDHGIANTYIGKRVAVHFAEPRYYNQVMEVTDIPSANTIVLGNDYAFINSANAQTDAVLTTVDHNVISLNNSTIRIDNTNSADGIVESFNRAIELRRGFTQDVGSFNLSFPMLKKTRDKLTGITGNQVAGRFPYVANLDGISMKNMAQTATMNIKPAKERKVGFVADGAVSKLRSNDNPSWRHRMAVLGTGGDGIASGRRNINYEGPGDLYIPSFPSVTQQPDIIINTVPEAPKPTPAVDRRPSFTVSKPAPEIKIPKIVPTTPRRRTPAIASNPGAPIIDPAPVTSIPKVDKCAPTPPVPPKKPKPVPTPTEPPKQNKPLRTNGQCYLFTHSGAAASQTEWTFTQRVSSARAYLDINYNGLVNGVKITVYQGTASAQNTQVITTASSVTIPNGEKFSAVRDFEAASGGFYKWAGKLRWIHNPSKGNFYRIVVEKPDATYQPFYMQMCLDTDIPNPQPRPIIKAEPEPAVRAITPKPRPKPKPIPPRVPEPADPHPQSPIAKPIGKPVNRKKLGAEIIDADLWITQNNFGLERAGRRFGIRSTTTALPTPFRSLSNFSLHLPPMTGLNLVPNAAKKSVKVNTGVSGRFTPVESGKKVSANLQKVSGGISVPFSKKIGRKANCVNPIAQLPDLSLLPLGAQAGITGALGGRIQIQPRKIGSDKPGFTQNITALRNFSQSPDTLRLFPVSTREPTGIVGCAPALIEREPVREVEPQEAPVREDVEFDEVPKITITPKKKDPVTREYKPVRQPAVAPIQRPTPTVRISEDDAAGVKPGDEIVINNTKIRLPDTPQGVLKSIQNAARCKNFEVKPTVKNKKPAIAIQSPNSAPITIRDGCRGGTYKEVLDFHINIQGLSIETSNASIAPATTGAYNGTTSTVPTAIYTHYRANGDVITTSTTNTTTGNAYSSVSQEGRGYGYVVGDKLRVVGGVPVADPFGSVASISIVNPGSGYSSAANVKVYIGDGSTAGKGAKAGRVTLDDSGGIASIELQSGGEGYDSTNLPTVRIVDTAADTSNLRPATAVTTFEGGSSRPERVAKFEVAEVDENGRILQVIVTDRGVYKQFPSDLVEGVPLEYDDRNLGDTGEGSSGLGVANAGSGLGRGARIFLTAREIPDCSERGDARRALGLPEVIDDIDVPGSLADDLNQALQLAGYDPEDIWFEPEDINDDVGMLTMEAPGFDGVEFGELSPGFLDKLGIPVGDYNPDILEDDLIALNETPFDDANPEIAGPGDPKDEDGFKVRPSPFGIPGSSIGGGAGDDPDSLEPPIGASSYPDEIISFQGATSLSLPGAGEGSEGNITLITDLFQYELRTPTGNPVQLKPDSQDAEVLYFESLRYTDETASGNVSNYPQLWLDNYQNRGWAYLENGSVQYQQQPLVDVEFVRDAIIYDEDTGEKRYDLQHWDPFKGIIPAFIDREIHYISETDPVAYRSSRSGFGRAQVGQVWWDTSTVRYQWYEMGTELDRWSNWGQAHPGSAITLWEWIESDRVPSEYQGTGTPKNNADYITERVVNPATGTYQTRYYYWVTGVNQLSVTAQLKWDREIALDRLQRLLINPARNGVPTISYISTDSFVASNLGNILRDDEDILQINLSRNLNPVGKKHTAFKLMREGDRRSEVPVDLSLKLIDSLAGENSIGEPVPDPRLSRVEAYGVKFRPRQSMFRDIREARRLMVSKLNSMLAEVRGSIRFAGWKNLVANSYSYFEVRNWYAVRSVDSVTGEIERYDETYKPVYRVKSAGELRTLGIIPDGSVVQVQSSPGDPFQLWIYNAPTRDYKLISVQNDSLRFKDSIFQDETNPTMSRELREILTVIRDAIFVETSEWNEFFLEMVKYAFAEQGQLDWAFKTSYLYIEREEEDLIQFSGFRSDNFENALAYLDEVKAYTAKVREYRDGKSPPRELIGLNNISDFDKPPYADPFTGRVRILDLDGDAALMSIDPQYRDWYRTVTNSDLFVETPQGFDVPELGFDSDIVWDGLVLVSTYDVPENPIRTIRDVLTFDRVSWQPLGMQYNAANTSITLGLAQHMARLNVVRETGNLLVQQAEAPEVGFDIDSRAWDAAPWDESELDFGDLIGENQVTEVRQVDRVFMYTPEVRALFDAEFGNYTGNLDIDFTSNATLLHSAIEAGALDGTLSLVKTLAQGDFRGEILDGNVFSFTNYVHEDTEVYTVFGFGVNEWDTDLGFDADIEVVNYEGIFEGNVTLRRQGETYEGFDGVTFKKMLYGEERPEELIYLQPLENMVVRISTSPFAFDANNQVVDYIGFGPYEASNISVADANGTVTITEPISSQFVADGDVIRLAVTGNSAVLASSYSVSNITGDTYTIQEPNLDAANLSALGTVNVLAGPNVTPVVYQMHMDMFGSTEYLRLRSEDATRLVAKVESWDDVIQVDDASVLARPGVDAPGVVWIGGERIEYQTLQGNTLRDIQRGTRGTTVSSHIAGLPVYNGVEDQTLRGNGLDPSYASWLNQDGSQESMVDRDNNDTFDRGNNLRFLQGDQVLLSVGFEIFPWDSFAWDSI
jgi:hypothetical protein